MQLVGYHCWSLAVALVFVGSSVAAGADTISLKSLLREMTTRETLARFPSPRYVCRQFSSYDRDSTNPNDHETWFANFDRSHFLRIEPLSENGEKEYVMMEADGPGAIVRMWGTWHGAQGKPFSNGAIRIYLDNQKEPAIEGPIQEVIDGGKLVGPPLGQGVSPQTDYNQQGHNLYLPIPYAKHCKATYTTAAPIDPGARTGEALYYQINYRAYEPGAEVESFSMQRLANAKQEMADLQARLTVGARPLNNQWKVTEQSASIQPQSQSEPITLIGAGAIRQLELKIDAKDKSQALRSTVLRIAFDGEQTVWCPIGDFFGVGYQLSPHLTWYTKVTKEGVMSCSWVMPYEKSAKLSFVNVGKQPVEIKHAKVVASDWQWDNLSLYFHATWRELHRIDTRKGSKSPGAGAFDVNYVTIDGKGVYVGDTLTLHNGAPSWWGEGDEKIYVDGEGFPSHFGTGTEDYYGYAWCRPESFSAPFHSQPEGKGNMRGGFSVNNRYRALDAIPFTKSLRFDIEQWHWADTRMNFAPSTFFYARPGAKVNAKPAPEAAAEPVDTSVPELPKAVYIEGAIEGETMDIISLSGGIAERQHGPQFRWSGDEQLWWRDAKPGDKLKLSFPNEQAGRYKVLVNLTKASDYGVVRISINDDKYSKELDRYHSSVTNALVDLGDHDLKQGLNHITLQLEGHNPQAIPRGMVGIDYLKLDRAQE